MRLFGVSGTNGSGKDSFGEILAAKHGYLFISVTDLLRDEAKKRGLPIEREVLRNISAEWRRQHGLGVLIDMGVKSYEEKGGDSNYRGLVLSSLRNPGEADSVHAHDGKVVWTDADAKIRYDRIYSRQRTAEDDKTFEQFKQEEQDEMSYSGDKATLSTAAVREKADIFLLNEGDTLESFEEVIAKELSEAL